MPQYFECEKCGQRGPSFYFYQEHDCVPRRQGLKPASEMRKLAENPAGPDIDEPLAKLMARIERVASEGQRSIGHPFHDLPMLASKRHIIQDAIKKALIAAGYEWEHRDSQDPGSPTDRPIDIIRW